MLEPHRKLDIDWEEFNDRLNRVDGVERKPAPHISLRQMIADGEKYYNLDNCAHHCYTSDNFNICITNILRQNTNVSKKEIYNYCLELKNEN